MVEGVYHNGRPESLKIYIEKREIQIWFFRKLKGLTALLSILDGRCQLIGGLI